jgi:hypothetical protein
MFAYLQLELTTISYFYLKIERTKFLQNVGKLLPDYIRSYLPPKGFFIVTTIRTSTHSYYSRLKSNGYFMLMRLTLNHLQYGIYSGYSSSPTMHLISLAFLDTIIQTICRDVLF